MVGPTPEEELAAQRRGLMAVVVLLVGASGGLIALQVEASLYQLLGAVGVGLLLGAVLAWYLFSGMVTESSRDRERERF
jgi:hypothetical protein